jgi:hypothetical protein
MDVEGDGNCGFYSLTLGLENNNDFTHSITSKNRPTSPMQRNTPWQYCVMRLRSHLRTESQQLTSTVYSDKPLELPWLPYTTIGTEEDFNQLSELKKISTNSVTGSLPHPSDTSIPARYGEQNFQKFLLQSPLTSNKHHDTVVCYNDLSKFDWIIYLLYPRGSEIPELKDLWLVMLSMTKFSELLQYLERSFLRYFRRKKLTSSFASSSLATISWTVLCCCCLYYFNTFCNTVIILISTVTAQYNNGYLCSQRKKETLYYIMTDGWDIFNQNPATNPGIHLPR